MDSGNVFHFAAQIRFSDTDMMGHVNHARFLSYLEDARVAMFSHIAPGTDLMTAGLILAHLDIDYRRPIHLSAESLDVACWVTDIGTKSFGVGYTLHQQQALAAEASARLVAYDYAEQTSRRLTPKEVEALGTMAGSK